MGQTLKETTGPHHVGLPCDAETGLQQLVWPRKAAVRGNQHLQATSSVEETSANESPKLHRALQEYQATAWLRARDHRGQVGMRCALGEI